MRVHPDDDDSLDQLASHHIFGRGMGGGKRSDHPHDVAVLCHHHHNFGQISAHNADWWNRKGQNRIQEHMLTYRTPVQWAAIYAYMEEKGYPIPG